MAPSKSPVPAKFQLVPTVPTRADVGDGVAADVVGLERAGRGVAQQHVAGVAGLEGAEPDEAPAARHLAERIGRQNRIAADVVDLVIPIAGVVHDHVGRGAAGGAAFVTSISVPPLPS